MNKTNLKILLGLALAGSAHAGDLIWNDSWTGQDKARHFVAGAAIGAATTVYFDNANYGIAAGCAVGALKEAHDMRRNTGTFQDFAVTCLGSFVGAKVVEGLYLSPRGINYTMKF